MDWNDLLGSRRREIPTGNSVVGAIVVTTARGLGIAVLVVGCVVGSLDILLRDVPSDASPLSLDIVALAGLGVGLGLVVGSYGLARVIDRPSGPPRTVPTLTAIVAETLLFTLLLAIVVLTVDPDGRIVAVVGVVTIPLGVFYRGWLWGRLDESEAWLRDHRLLHPWRGRGVAHAAVWGPVAALCVALPQIGVGTLSGLFVGHLFVRAYRDVVLPLRA